MRLEKLQYILLTMIIFILNSCTVDITGAPCSSDENCPRGQYCYQGICIKGESKDINGALDTTEVSETVDQGGYPDTSGDEDISSISDISDISDVSTTECQRDEDCSSDSGKKICINGTCMDGECHQNSDCKVAGYPTCEKNHYCSNSCAGGLNCGDGFVCCNDRCMIGTCCVDNECPSGKRCLNNICVNQCEKNEDCPSKKCCDKSICAEELRGCCSSIECENSPFGFNCINYLCSCTSDYECPSNMICDKTKSPGVCVIGCSDIHRCEAGDTCCNSKCTRGECCEDKDCKQPGYPRCAYLNGRNVCVDLCDPNSQNPCNSTDGKYRCCKQPDGKYRCVVANCCTNWDCKEPDKPYCETALETPACINKCNLEVKCGENYICCFTSNDGMCFWGNCCDETQCKNGEKCINHQCAAGDCTINNPACMPPSKCCMEGDSKGLCYSGDCCADSECANNINGSKCLIYSNKCGCVTNDDCQNGYVCANNQCIKGDCVTSADCEDELNPICINNYCSPCQNSSDCQTANKGNLCCKGRCINGNCCGSIYPSTPNCESLTTKPVCRDFRCSACLSNTECKDLNLGDKCCTTGGLAGDCYTGECCSSYDCVQSGKITAPICNKSQYTCMSCTSDTECINELGSNNLKCCTVKNSQLIGSCYAGECCDDSQCSAYQNKKRCNLSTHTCVECLTHSDCGVLGVDYICCNNQCIRGECCYNSDCITNQQGNYCYQYHCRTTCTTSDDCTENSIYSACCKNLKTSPFPFCVYSENTNCCTSDAQCNATEKCCYGICILKASICK